MYCISIKKRKDATVAKWVQTSANPREYLVMKGPLEPLIGIISSTYFTQLGLKQIGQSLQSKTENWLRITDGISSFLGEGWSECQVSGQRVKIINKWVIKM